VGRVRALVAYVGVLRALLYTATLVLAASAPFAGGEVRYSGWAMYPTLLSPILTAAMFFVLALDVLMSWVFMYDLEGPARARYRNLLRIEALLLLLLALAWLPFFLSLART